MDVDCKTILKLNLTFIKRFKWINFNWTKAIIKKTSNFSGSSRNVYDSSRNIIYEPSCLACGDNQAVIVLPYLSQ